MNEPDDKELTEIDGWLDELQKRRAARLEKLGIAGPAPSISTAHREEDERVRLWDRMTPPERLDLYHNNRGEWERILAAKEADGARKLLRSRGW
jgi:hypothetical protein